MQQHRLHEDNEQKPAAAEPTTSVEDKTMPLYVSAHSFITSTYVSFHVPDDKPGQFTATAAGTLCNFLLLTKYNYYQY